MTPHDWYIENRIAYVARALEPSEERLFADHLSRCEECSREVARLEHLQQRCERRFRCTSQLAHQSPAQARCHEHLLRSGFPVQPAVLARDVDVEGVVRVLDGGDP